MVSRVPSAPLPSPEREELDLKWREFASLREQVVEGELTFQSLDETLRTFEQNYLLRCGSRYLALDAVEAEIEELLAARRQHDVPQQQKAKEARAKATQTQEDVQQREQEGPRRTVKKTPELKALYRRVARQVHPDLASSEEESRYRHDFMVELNACYARGDLERMQQIAVEWEACTGEVAEASIPEQLVRVIRAIANLRRRIAQLTKAIRDLEMSELAQLQRDVLEGLKDGSDLIADLIERLDQQILEAHERLDRLKDMDTERE